MADTPPIAGLARTVATSSIRETSDFLGKVNPSERIKTVKNRDLAEREGFEPSIRF